MEKKQINIEFIPYKHALEIKELGFDEPCFGTWDRPDKLWTGNPVNGILDIPEDIILAPLYQQAFRWFREKYNIISEIKNWSGENQWYYMIHYNDQLMPWRWVENKSYEEVELECIKKLIEIVKQNGKETDCS